MPHAVTSASTGLQALILCGPGSSFPTFTSNPDENPKALLPVANRPMVWYPLDFCYRMGITKISLVCPKSASQAITTALKINPFLTGLPLPRPDILAPTELDQNAGTAEILRLPEVRNAITGDFIVLPCDLVCELSGERLLKAWMVKAASLTNLLGASRFTNGIQSHHSGGLGVWYETKAGSVVKGEETDFIATTPLRELSAKPLKDSIFPEVAKLVQSMPTDSLNDLTEERKALPIRHGLMKAYPRVRMLTTHRDAHLYIFPHWILDFVRDNERMESISEDVVGWWAKAGWQTGLAQKLHIDTICPRLHPEEESQSTPESVDSAHDPNTASQTSKKPLPSSLSARQLKTKDKGSSDDQTSEYDVPPILAYLHSNHEKDSSGLTRRVDTAQLLLAVSLQLAKLPSLEEAAGEAASPFAHAKKLTYPEGVKSRTTITKQDSLIGENVTVEEKTSIKESVIGANCQINEGAKLSQCLLMEGVVVGKGCKLTKCILGKRCVIGDGSVLTDCEVQENLLVEPQTEDKDNRLMSSEGLEATEAEMEDVLKEQDEALLENNDAIVE